MQSNLTFIIAAYAVTWAAVLGYLLYLARRAARARAAFEQAANVAGAKVT